LEFYERNSEILTLPAPEMVVPVCGYWPVYAATWPAGCCCDVTYRASVRKWRMVFCAKQVRVCGRRGKKIQVNIKRK